MQTFQTDADNKSLGLYDGTKITSIVRVWWFYRRFIITTMIFATIATMLIIGRQEKLFTSSSLIRIHYAPEDSVIAGTPNGREQRNNSVIANSVVFMSSRSFLSMVAEEQGLFDDPEFKAEPTIPRAGEEFIHGPDHDSILRNAVVDALAERIVVAQRGGSHVISVEVTSNDPEKAARIASTAVEIFRDKELSRLENMEQKYLDWLTVRIRDSRGKLASLEGKALALSSKHGINELGEDPFLSQAANVQWTELNTQLANTKAERAAIQARHENARSWAEKPGVGSSLAIAKSPALDELRNFETTLVRRLSEFRGGLGERHPTIVNLRNELTLTRQRMLDEANTLLIRTRGELLTSNAKEAEIEARIAKLNQSIIDRQGIKSEIREINHEIDKRQDEFEILAEKQLNIRESQMIRLGMSDIMSPASVPTKHSYPNNWPLIAYASLGTMLLSLLGIFFHERWVSDFGFTSPKDIEALHFNPIGIVPELTRDAPKGTAFEDYVVTFPHTVEAEATQRIRSHLLKLRPNDSDVATVVVITSSSPQEGKTTMAVALARQAAIAGSKVLCIDANIHQPGVADLVGLETAAGLSELLSNDQYDEPQIGEDPYTDLHILQPGICTASPADLLLSKKMAQSMEELRQRYDWIFVDSPSVGAVVDGIILAKHADLVVYAARWLETTRNVVLMGIDRLRSVGVTCTCVALTRVSMASYRKYEHVDEFGYYGYSYRKT